MVTGGSPDIDDLEAHVELVYDPFDLTAPITVTGPGGAPGTPDAVLLDIRRHVHPKTAAASRDADPGAANAASGIDYLPASDRGPSQRTDDRRPDQLRPQKSHLTHQ
ncbi:hypothetical protein [Arthrobacter castelli]|uniref:hypothetical protein n=1 Tax=Arthrobacter castelli TaxID=271431 RepID=UPI000415B221|nr:hypothetical protein [Arthrobacter castelli]